MLAREQLLRLYEKRKLSVPTIAKQLDCSEHKVNYWLAQHKIKKRSISDAIYQFHNPKGDPFLFKRPRTTQEGILYGLGLGLYWGEGSKRGNGGVKLGNTDVRLIRTFIVFLEKNFDVKKKDLKFGLQIFSDLEPDAVRAYWMRTLKIREEQFYKTIVSKVRGEGTYKYKSQHGVLSVYFNNTRLKKSLCEMIDTLQ